MPLQDSAEMALVGKSGAHRDLGDGGFRLTKLAAGGFDAQFSNKIADATMVVTAESASQVNRMNLHLSGELRQADILAITVAQNFVHA